MNLSATLQSLFDRLSERRFGQTVVALMAMGFGALLLAGITAAIVMRLADDRTRWVEHTYVVERRMDALRIDLTRLESSRRGYILNRDASFLAINADAARDIPTDIDTLDALTADNPMQRGHIASLRAEATPLLTLANASIALAKAGRAGEAAQTFAVDGSVQHARAIDRITSQMIVDQERLLKQRAQDQAKYTTAFYVIVSISGLLLVLVAIASVLVIMRYTRELGKSRDRLQDLNDNLEQAVETRTTDLRRANDEIQRFAYIVSHDLRSPLVNVLGFTAELDAAGKQISRLLDQVEARDPAMVDDDMRAAVRTDIPEAIQFIRGSTQKMDRLINAILKLSREGRRVVMPELLDMNILVQGIADSLHQRTQDAGAEIIIDKPLPAVISDRVSVEQVLSNLIENAVKYSDPARPGRITVSGKLSSGRVIYSVADNGRGIDPKDHERIFDLFRRSGVQDQPGEGIGLAHVRASAYRLGGMVTCDSRLGEGATFQVSLPAVYAAEETAA